MMYRACMKYKYLWLFLALLFCLGAVGCSVPDAMCVDDKGVPQHGETEFAWFLINSFNLIFENPLRFLGIIVLIFVLLGVGGNLYANGHPILGTIVMIGGAAILAYIFTIVFFFLAMVFGLMLGGFRKH